MRRERESKTKKAFETKYGGTENGRWQPTRQKREKESRKKVARSENTCNKQNLAHTAIHTQSHKAEF